MYICTLHVLQVHVLHVHVHVHTCTVRVHAHNTCLDRVISTDLHAWRSVAALSLTSNHKVVGVAGLNSRNDSCSSACWTKRVHVQNTIHKHGL